MLGLLVLLMDLVLVSSMSVLMSSNTSTLYSLGLGILLTIRVTLNTIVRHQLDRETPPATAVNALLKRTEAPQGDRCPVCLDGFFKPRKISCNHVFCRDCALLMLCKRETCPLCQRIALQQREVKIVVPFGNLAKVFFYILSGWLQVCFVMCFAWIVPCFSQWRLPTSSELMLATMRATIQTALRTMVFDVVCSIASLRSRSDRGLRLMDVIAILCTSVATLPYDYAGRAYIPLFAAVVAQEYCNDSR